MKEQDIQTKIIKTLVTSGFDVVKIIRCNRNGVSDILACSPTGRFWAVEVKRPGQKPSALQVHYVNEIVARNGVAFVAHSVEDVTAALSKHTTF